MYYKLFDTQTGSDLATGFNSESFKELAEDYCSYKSIDAEDEKEWQDHFNSLTEEEQKNYIESDEFVIEKSEEKFDDEWIYN